MCTVSICVFSLISDLCFSFCQSASDFNTHTNPFIHESHRNIIVIIIYSTLLYSTLLIVWHVSISSRILFDFSRGSPFLQNHPFSHSLYIYMSAITKCSRSLLNPYVLISINETPPISSLISLKLLIS